MCLGLIALCLFVSGCNQGARSLSLDTERARAACTEFLSAWKAGQQASTLQPGIIGRDYAWDGGETLVDFKLLPDEVNDGTNLHIPVKLTLKDKTGRESDSEVTYVVGTSPVVTVMRE